MTTRAIRILSVALGGQALFLILGEFVIWQSYTSHSAKVVLINGLFILVLQSTPLILILANVLLGPLQSALNNRFISEAKAIIQRYGPKVIAITGSYGKTSTKHILGHVLSTVGPTLVTPGSVNTLLGVTRIIREKLRPDHRFFLVEMGAYGPGSIASLCELTPPNLSAITAVGCAHYERFKTIDAVAQAKFELADATRRNGGCVIINGNMVDDKYISPLIARNVDRVSLVANMDVPNVDTFVLTDAQQTSDGMNLNITYRDRRYRITSPLYGFHQSNNVAVAFAMAIKLGIPGETIVAALRSVPQVQHRLQVFRVKGQPTIIDNAYNSNPIGFASALELLDMLGGQDKRRILVTPGMVELGARHEAEHYRLGRIAGTLVDVALVIGAGRIPSFLEGFATPSRSEKKLLTLQSFAEAKQWLDKNATPTDVILYENDLPDLYEMCLHL